MLVRVLNPHPRVANVPIVLKCPKPSKIPQNPQTWGEHIKKRRLELGFFQRQVAELLGVDENTVTNWEKRRKAPQLYLLPKVIEFLGYHPIADEPRTLGEKLIQYRKSKGISQKELARRIGIDQGTVARIEKNKKSFGEVLRKIDTFLNRSI